jgi:peroxiredoxin
MKMKKSILIGLVSLPALVFAQGKRFTVQGQIGTLEAPAKAYLKYSNDGNNVVDSAILRKGRFTLTGKLSSPVAADLIIKHDTAATPKFAMQDSLHFYIENADITVTAKDSIWRAVVRGSSTNDEDRTLSALQQPYRRTFDSVAQVFYSWTPEEQKDTTLTKRKQLGSIYLSAQDGYRSVSRAFIAKHPNSYISLVVFKEIEFAYDFDPSLNPDTTAVKFARFPASLRESPLGKQMAALIETGEKTKTGKVAMDFTQFDSTGKAVKLSDYRGHYVLVDFWASWCMPCRAENPNLLAAYNKYKDKNFTILGVSLDDEKGRKAWLAAVKYDRLPWTQVSELKGKNKAAVLYGVSAIPTNFLIDPNGKIIAKNLRGEELDKTLAALFSM